MRNRSYFSIHLFYSLNCVIICYQPTTYARNSSLVRDCSSGCGILCVEWQSSDRAWRTCCTRLGKSFVVSVLFAKEGLKALYCSLGWTALLAGVGWAGLKYFPWMAVHCVRGNYFLWVTEQLPLSTQGYRCGLMVFLDIPCTARIAPTPTRAGGFCNE